jgi:transglutaminase-like putative cysteine protease
MSRLRFSLVVLVLFAGHATPASAEPRAVIVVGLAAGETQAERLRSQAQTVREGFLARGLAPSAITVLGTSGERLRRDAVLAALAPSTADETWIVLLGTSSARNGEPSFQVSGPRLTATDLTTAIKTLPGRTFVVIATPAAGGFLPPLLALPGVEAVAATADSGEVNEPRFAGAWAESLVATPRASFAELAASAARRVATFYESASLAQGEHARLIDRAANRIIDAPFSDVAGSLINPSPRPAAPASGFSVADIDIPQPADDTEITRLPATGETRALLAEARAAAKDSAHAALCLRRDLAVTIGGDFSVTERHRRRTFLRTGESLDELGTLLLPSNPPDFFTRLEGVRIITPDGSQILVNPRTFDERRAADRREADDARAQNRPAGPLAPPFLPLPEVTAGCLIEVAWSVERRDSSSSIPEFSEQWSLAEHYPVRLLNLTITTPADARWTTFAPNLPAATVASTASSRTSTWTLADQPAFEPRAGDPPAGRITPWVGVSSLASWEAFAAWYRRIATGSDDAGPGVAALADAIAQAHPDRAGRLRAACERVSSLRYVAIGLGVGAFRPRTPEQVWTRRYGDCKDKANLLVAVLDKLGIPAEFALVNRFGHTFTEWPSWQFNHALARVPASPADGQPRDLWLDTTDRLVPFGIVAPGNLGRPALAFSRDFSQATFHEITATQEPPSEWRETITRPLGDLPAPHLIKISASGSAEVSLRRLLVGLGPVARHARLQELFGAPISSVSMSDPYDLQTPFFIEFGAYNPSDSPPAFIPGLVDYLTPSDRPRLWDDGREWTYIRALPSGGEIRQAIPSRLP